MDKKQMLDLPFLKSLPGFSSNQIRGGRDLAHCEMRAPPLATRVGEIELPRPRSTAPAESAPPSRLQSTPAVHRAGSAPPRRCTNYDADEQHAHLGRKPPRAAERLQRPSPNARFTIETNKQATSSRSSARTTGSRSRRTKQATSSRSYPSPAPSSAKLPGARGEPQAEDGEAPAPCV